MRRTPRGFTLVEMSLVLVIVALLLTAGISSIRAQMDNARAKETRQALSEIREALLAFAIRTGRLPCPAKPTLSSSDPNAGMEATQGNACDNAVDSRTSPYDSQGGYEGVIPWQTLGVRELDAWGSRFTYRVTDVVEAGGGAQTRSFARSLSASAPLPCAGQTQRSTIGLCSSGNISTVNNSSMGGQINGQFLVAVIVSHGKNKLGAFTSDGQQIGGASGDELKNADRNSVFVNSNYLDAPNQTGIAQYDDLIEWLPSTILIGKLVSASKLP